MTYYCMQSQIGWLYNISFSSACLIYNFDYINCIIVHVYIIDMIKM